MKTVRTPLPELEARRPDPIATPRIRTANRGLSGGSECLHSIFQPSSRWDDTALRRRQGTDLRVDRAAGEVRVGFGIAHWVGASADVDLTVERKPDEQQGDPPLIVDLPTLAGPGVGEEHEPVGVERLHQHGPRAGHTTRRHRGKHHGVRLLDLGGDRLAEPTVELLDRVVSGIGHRQRRALVVDAEPANTFIAHDCNRTVGPASIALPRGTEPFLHSGA